MTPFSLAEADGRFGDAYCLHHQNEVSRLSSLFRPTVFSVKLSFVIPKKSKADPLHAMEALGGRGGIAPTHSRPRH
jgi:hypothetical protein